MTPTGPRHPTAQLARSSRRSGGRPGRLAGLLLLFALASGCTRTEVVVTEVDGGGYCTDAGCQCPTGTEACDGRCVDLQSDPEHCGECETYCGALEECREGRCECLAGAERCGEDFCSDLQRDPNHCGICNETCESGETCVAGSCVCSVGLERCGDDCVDTASSAEHCGDCGHRCAEDAAGEYCWDGQCTAIACELRSPSAEGCGSSDRDCVPSAALAWNPLHCGGCDEACAGSEVCTQGVCQAYFVPFACTICPCGDCGQNLCCPFPGTTLPVCVVGAQTCPVAP